MKARRVLASVFLVLLSLYGFDRLFASPQSLQQQNEILLRQLQRVHGLSDAQIDAIRKIFARSGYIGQGNAAITQHPLTPEESEAKDRIGLVCFSICYNPERASVFYAPEKLFDHNYLSSRYNRDPIVDTADARRPPYSALNPFTVGLRPLR